MARIRSVHPDICSSETLAALSAEHERCFVRLWTHCDDEGRCKDNPVIIAAQVFAANEEVTSTVVDAWLDELQDANLITRYSTQKGRVIQVSGWDEYQHPQKPKKSDYPPPADTSTRQVRDESSDEGATPTVGRGGERRGEEGNTPSSADADGVPDGFAEFWEACPRKVGKKAAAKAWTKALDDDVFPDELVDAMKAHAKWWDSYGTGIRYIPHPATWLNQGRWMDVLVSQDTGPPEFHRDAGIERNQRRARGEACERCADTNWVEDDNGVVHLCRHQEVS